MDPHDELRQLVADARAVLEHNVRLGMREEALAEEAGTPHALPAATVPAAAARELGLGLDAPSDEDLAAVRLALGDCQRCGLCAERQNIVFGVGSEHADLMVIGEGPGAEEDRRGEPFVGPAGEMLDNMLVRVLGLPRDQVYIANIVKCRPPGNRNPLPPEVEACLPFLHRQIRAIRPKVILVLGTVALKNLFDTTEGITRSRGRWRTFEGIPVMPTFHPAYLLRRPTGKRDTFTDLKALRARYDELGGSR